MSMTLEEKKNFERIKETIGRHEDRISRLRMFSKGSRADLVKALEGEIATTISANEQEAWHVLEMETDELFRRFSTPAAALDFLRACGRARRSYRAILSNMKDAPGKIESIELRIGDLNNMAHDLSANARNRGKNRNGKHQTV